MPPFPKLEDKSATIGVVGLGYVGLPLVLAFARSGYRSIGFDIDASKIETLSAGESYISHIPSSLVAGAKSSGPLDATTDFSRLAGCDAIILCVPTPLDQDLNPDIGYITGTLDSVLPHLHANQILSLESTTYPGTTEEEVVSRVENAGFTVGEDLFVVYSPEREDPGNRDFALKEIPKVVGGHTAACLEAGVALYADVFDTIVPVSSTKVAELTKLLENIYRAVNIGLVNELKITADKMGIDIWEVIAAASTKPFGFTPFYPGPGLGGHCIPIDPFYLTWKAREHGVHTRFIELAGEINRAMPEYVVQRTVQALESKAKSVNGCKILLLGLAYKADIDDMRESPAFVLMDCFRELGAHVSYHDPHIPVIGPTRNYMHWAGRESLAWTSGSLAEQDAIVIATNHAAFDLKELAAHANLIIDTRNAMHGIPTRAGQVVKA